LADVWLAPSPAVDLLQVRSRTGLTVSAAPRSAPSLRTATTNEISAQMRCRERHGAASW
jgi:hypothetical protein